MLFLTVTWNVVEAFVAIGAGIISNSLALTGFGLDSVIETFAAIVTIRGFNKIAKGLSEEEIREQDEKTHKLVGITFFALTGYIFFSAGSNLWKGKGAEESLVGIILAGLSLAVMPILGWLKLKTASKIGSRALSAEAKETIACAYLSLTLFLGLLSFALFNWWWVDSLTALLLTPWLIKEGLEAFHEEGE